MEGGASGAMGRNTWIKRQRQDDGDVPEGIEEDSDIEPRYINIGGKATVYMGKGDRLLIETPGGGGWGAPTNGEKAGTGIHVQTWEPRGSFAERAAKQAGF